MKIACLVHAYLNGTKDFRKAEKAWKMKFKAMLIVFFDIQGIVMAECVPSCQTVNQQYYVEVLTRERVRRKRPELWRNGWIVH